MYSDLPITASQANCPPLLTQTKWDRHAPWLLTCLSGNIIGGIVAVIGTLSKNSCLIGTAVFLQCLSLVSSAFIMFTPKSPPGLLMAILIALQILSIHYTTKAYTYYKALANQRVMVETNTETTSFPPTHQIAPVSPMYHPPPPNAPPSYTASAPPQENVMSAEKYVYNPTYPTMQPPSIQQNSLQNLPQPYYVYKQ